MTGSDSRWMTRALRLAARGLGRTSPNPVVGAVIVADGIVIGEGYHQQAGGPHAEAFALQAAGTRARGATMYVTLEPCSHYGRTPPCAEAIIAAGLRRVVAAMQDPHPQVNGCGLARLRAAGIEVEVGVGEEQARRLNAPFLKHTTTGLPLVSLKAAMSLDGKIATRTGESQWITGEKARAYGHRLRAQHDAVMAGIGTVLADNPRLTARGVKRNSKFEIRELKNQSRISNLRVIVDSTARTPLGAAILTADSRPPLIAVTASAPVERIAALKQAGAEVWVIPAVRQELAFVGQEQLAPRSLGEVGCSCPMNPAEEKGKVDLTALMRRLGEHGIQSVLVEGGGTLAGALLAAGLVDRVYFFLAPIIIGGQHAPGPIGGDGLTRLADAWRLTNLTVKRIGEDLLVSGDIAQV